jgi:concanavalin A-like lectin/glucanase superfamily protein
MNAESFRVPHQSQHRPWKSAGLALALGAFLLLRATGSAAPAGPPSQVVWNFDRIDRIGGHPTTVLGHPRVINTPIGKAVEFNGVDDALVIGVHPLAGAETFTWEAIFRPDGGNAEQRWFHLEENPATGLDSNNRMLFEIRVIDGRWCLDAFNKSGAAQKALLNRSSLHALGAWYHVAAVYDGKEFRNYVDGVQDGAGEIHLAPQGAGQTSVGMRMNKVFYFKGAVHSARFTRRALSPAEFLKVKK